MYDLVHSLLAAHDGPCPDSRGAVCCRCEAAGQLESLLAAVASGAVRVVRLSEELDDLRHQVGGLTEAVEFYERLLGDAELVKGVRIFLRDFGAPYLTDDS